MLDYQRLHDLCGWHEEAIRNSQLCGCFYCMEIFSPSAISEWVEESEDCPRGPGKTAVCPKCGIDAVLPDSVEPKLTKELLKEMNQRWF